MFISSPYSNHKHILYKVIAYIFCVSSNICFAMEEGIQKEPIAAPTTENPEIVITKNPENYLQENPTIKRHLVITKEEASLFDVFRDVMETFPEEQEVMKIPIQVKPKVWELIYQNLDLLKKNNGHMILKNMLIANVDHEDLEQAEKFLGNTLLYSITQKLADPRLAMFILVNTKALLNTSSLEAFLKNPRGFLQAVSNQLPYLKHSRYSKALIEELLSKYTSRSAAEITPSPKKDIFSHLSYDEITKDPMSQRIDVAAFSPNKKFLACFDNEKKIVSIFNVDQDYAYLTTIPLEGTVSTALFNNTGDTLYFDEHAIKINRLDINTKKITPIWNIIDIQNLTQEQYMELYAQLITSELKLSLNPSGNTLAIHFFQSHTDETEARSITYFVSTDKKQVIDELRSDKKYLSSITFFDDTQIFIPIKQVRGKYYTGRIRLNLYDIQTKKTKKVVFVGLRWRDYVSGKTVESLLKQKILYNNINKNLAQIGAYLKRETRKDPGQKSIEILYLNTKKLKPEITPSINIYNSYFLNRTFAGRPEIFTSLDGPSVVFCVASSTAPYLFTSELIKINLSPEGHITSSNQYYLTIPQTSAPVKGFMYKDEAFHHIFQDGFIRIYRFKPYSAAQFFLLESLIKSTKEPSLEKLLDWTSGKSLYAIWQSLNEAQQELLHSFSPKIATPTPERYQVPLQKKEKKRKAEEIKGPEGKQEE